MIDTDAIRAQFPALNIASSAQGTEPPLVYLDSAATSQKPTAVLDSIEHFYSQHNANVHRGNHQLTASASQLFETARATVAQFIGAQSPAQVIWTKGATEAINLVAQSYARSVLKAGDEILVSEMEHHANIVPWQLVAEQTGASIVKLPITPNCTLDMEQFQARLSDKTKIVAVAHISNVTGTRNPIEAIIEAAHKVGAIVVVDGAQGIIHERINLSTLNADFYLFSGHKLYAPTGIGVLYGKLELLKMMPPWQGGGKMVDRVSFSGTRYAPLPGKFEAGTPNIAGAIALAAAIDWLDQFELNQIENHIQEMQQRTYHALKQIAGIRVIGYQQNSSIISFMMDGVHHQDIATLLDQQGVAVRSGHHCAHPLMDALSINGTIRVSFAIYNTVQDVERLLCALKKAIALLK